MHLKLFYIIFFIFHTYNVILCDILRLFLKQNFKPKVLSAQKKSSFRMSVKTLGGLVLAYIHQVGEGNSEAKQGGQVVITS